MHVLAEAVGPDAEALSDALAAALEDAPGLQDAALATSETDRARLWALRESHTEVLAPADPVKLDVAVPLERSLASFLERLPEVVAAVAPGVTPVPFGHLAEGNVHVNLPGARPFDTDGAVRTPSSGSSRPWAGRSAPSTASGARSGAGCTSAEDPADIAAMRAVKQALDPVGLLSPGRVLPDA